MALSPLYALPLLAAGFVKSPDGVRLRYESAGSGKPALVFVHCWTCDSSFWDGSFQRFAKRQQVVRLDLAGHGRSGRERKDYTIQAFAQDVKAVVDALKLERAVLIGHSMGGPVILEAASLLGDRVVGLVPVDTLLDVERKDDPKEMAAFMEKLRADFKGTATAFLREWMFVPGSDPKLIDRLLTQTTAFPREIGLSALQHTWEYDAAKAMSALKVPVVAVNADKFPTNVEGNRRHTPRFDAVVMKGVGHYLMLEDPQRFADHLDEALRRLAAIGPAQQ
jgi:pimeloyl-ACP methyl ester carboxylesterase